MLEVHITKGFYKEAFAPRLVYDNKPGDYIRSVAARVMELLTIHDDKAMADKLSIYAAYDSDNECSSGIQAMVVGALGVPAAHEEITEPGYIYVVSSQNILRKMPAYASINLSLVCPNDLILEMTINPRQLGYAIEFSGEALEADPELPNKDIGFLVATPHPVQPHVVETPGYLLLKYLHQVSYKKEFFIDRPTLQ